MKVVWTSRKGAAPSDVYKARLEGNTLVMNRMYNHVSWPARLSIDAPIGSVIIDYQDIGFVLNVKWFDSVKKRTVDRKKVSWIRVGIVQSNGLQMLKSDEKRCLLGMGLNLRYE